MHANGEVVTDLEVEMAGIHAKVCSHGSDLVAAFNFLADLDLDFVKVAVERVDVFDFPVGGITVGVPDEDNVSPALADIVSEGDNAVGAGVDGVAKVCVAAAATVPILTEVGGGAEAEAARFVITGGIRFADREIEAVCNGHFHSCLSGVVAKQHSEDGHKAD